MSERDHATDEAEIGGVLTTVARAFRELDASVLRDVYAEDADWTNAFGTTLHGRDEIVEYLAQLFENPHFARGEAVSGPDASIRFVGDDVAVAKTYVEREGQESVDGDDLDTRHDHSMKVLTRRDDGWVIVSDMYMDERDEETISE